MASSNIWRDLGPELSVLAALLFMVGAGALTFILTH